MSFLITLHGEYYVTKTSSESTEEQKDELFQDSTLLLPHKILVSQNMATSCLGKTCMGIP